MEEIFPTRQQQTDHDVLIELRTEMRSMRVDMKDIRDNFSNRVSALESTSLSAKERSDILSDIESVKMKIWFAMGGLAIITATVIPLVIYIFNMRVIDPDIISKSVTEAITEYNINNK